MKAQPILYALTAALTAALTDWAFHEAMFALGVEHFRNGGTSATILYLVVGAVFGLVALATRPRQGILRTATMAMAVVGGVDLLLVIALLQNREPITTFLPNFLRANAELLCVSLFSLGAAAVTSHLGQNRAPNK